MMNKYIYTRCMLYLYYTYYNRYPPVWVFSFLKFGISLIDLDDSTDLPPLLVEKSFRICSGGLQYLTLNQRKPTFDS